jgi:hypothetical protein
METTKWRSTWDNWMVRQTCGIGVAGVACSVWLSVGIFLHDIALALGSVCISRNTQEKIQA